jgi:hypothetical protein
MRRLNLESRFNLVALLLTLVVLVATWAIANLARRRPAFARPREVGPWELVVFVLGPAIPSLLYGQWADALKATVLALVPLGIVYVATSDGVVPMLRWASERSLALASTSRQRAGRPRSRSRPESGPTWHWSACSPAPSR